MTAHANLAPVTGLLGVWRGPGHGEYPTIESFDYTEELTFTDIGKPFLEYRQRTRAADGRPLHTETGYLRVPAPDRIEFVLAQPTGHTELCEGSLQSAADGWEIRLRSAIVSSESAKHVESTERVYRLTGDVLTVDFAMASVGQPMTHHLHVELQRVADG